MDQRSRITEGPTVQSALALTDSEAQALNTIAAGFVHRASAVPFPSLDMVFQSRLDYVESGKESEALKQYLERMNAERDAALANAMQQLRSAFGEARYQQFDAWLRSKGNEGCWIAPCAAAKK